MKAIELNDILTYKFLSEIRYAPGGRRAAFVVANADEEENTYERRLWLYEDGKTRQLTAIGKEGSFCWLDDERLIFPAVRTAKEKKRAEAKEAFTPYYVLDLRGGEALPLFELPFAVSGIRVLDGTHFAVSAAVDKRYPELWSADKEEREKVKKEREEDKDYEVFDELPFWGNGEGVTNGKRERLFLVSLDPLKVEPVTQLPDDLLDFAVMGDEVFFAVNPRAPRLSIRGFALRAVNWKTGGTRAVLEDGELCFEGMESAGERLWLFANALRRFGLNENAWIYGVDTKTGALSVVREEEYGMYGSVGSDCRLGGGRQCLEHGGSLYHLTTREGSCVLHRLDADGGDTPLVTKEGSIDAFDVCGDEALLIALYDMRLQELYRADLKTGEVTRVSDFNAAALEDRYVARPEPLSFESCGRELGGWVLKPRDFDPAKKYPAVLDVHGGPKTVYGPVFYHEMQLWAGMGYFVFFCNPVGSDGRDNAFADIRGRYGAEDYQNLMDFTDAVLKAYPQIDEKRVCETGGSYGGFMTNWIIGHTDRFCCAASQRSISNWLSFYGTSDIGFYFGNDQNDADFYDEPEKLWEHSPLKYVKNAKTPTLFIHSDEDYRCPLEQGIQMYAALVDRGVEARLCLFHGENHELSRSGKPKHRLRRLKEITDWFEKHSNHTSA
ncbi:MAG: S9 family peptidase [Ruminococcaceae bacterium]|nr:S9 family peptidase [Oscillospiraceae bacterium]